MKSTKNLFYSEIVCKILILPFFFILYFSLIYSLSTDRQERISFSFLNYEFPNNYRILGVQTFFCVVKLCTNNNFESRLLSCFGDFSFSYLRSISIESLSKSSLCIGLNLGDELRILETTLAYGCYINGGGDEIL